VCYRYPIEYRWYHYREIFTNATNEQATAISQFNTGIDQVAQVIQQNSATAEESAAASQELFGQAERLKQSISQFELR